MPDLDAAGFVGEVVERLARTGLPSGYWLVQIEQALVGVRSVETLLADLRDAIIDQHADDHDPP